MAQPIRRANSGTFVGAPSFLASMRCASFKVDEGYSEDTRSQSENDILMRSDSRLEEMTEADGQVLPDWLLSMNEADRSEFTYMILRTLRTSSIASIVDRLNPLLHLDPVLHLPPEVTSIIFSYLTPDTLLKTSALSKSWRGRALDSQLWRLLFRLEGWTADPAKMRAFEDEERLRRSGLRDRKSRVRFADRGTERFRSKKRAYDSGKSRDGPTPMTVEEPDITMGWAEQHGKVEADESLNNSPDRMQDVSFESDHIPMPAASTPLEPPVKPSLLLDDSSDNPRINWHYLYKQKRRLEDNWNAGRFKNFQFPNPDYPQEAHTECVYTIQYSGKHLVSGSRDKSVRIWNMETQRLTRPPLLGHSASVLCLQFDDSPQEDVVISGGSDCHIIVWRFSTGKLLKKLSRAHSESVLNLRFDENYLISCSKDKSIKVWNRKQLLPTDPCYPIVTTAASAHFPQHIISMDQVPDLQRNHIEPLPEYSLIMTLQGHTAAVNAIQIYDKQIVSASGDRSVKVWDVRTGKCLKTFQGHTKGIACVQFDGRRIVSGSSDESVRIFDQSTGAEVACLNGHKNLVRTVQASFGDFPGNEEELEAEARKVDREFFEARDRGMLGEDSLSRDRRRMRNAGSKDPKDIFAYGAKLPPGGGGSRWARIVSGSYDESVIVWKKDAESGNWVVSKILLQNEAVRSAGDRPRNRPTQQHQQAHNHPHGQTGQQNQQQQQQQGGAQNAGNAHNAVNQLVAVQANFQALAAQAHAQVAHAQMLAQQAQALHQQANNAQAAQAAQAAASNNQNAPHGLAATNAAPNNATNRPTAHQSSTQHAPGQGQSSGQPSSQAQHSHSQSQTQAQATQNQSHNAPGTASAAASNNAPANAPAPQAQPHHHHHNHNHAHGHGHNHHHHHHHPLGPLGVQQGTNSRVFKLQFDARRIICCSQDPTIVGWDFADGDADIISASQFFGELQ
ncbi:WD40 repeat-like protein [Pseudovirgaria hyperparasitica]|uniref:WD40 repeat-like protein n=1 Tax=Pseudovirgaria hyperparasitica TaxID=470096 RepID=A0A6A6VVZ4_9PEZI|nr:WD40 repeat-like protein [Pseudovirgaria hyperparasitica]KAF2753966.1 WD40 repeat-like protein [Pseudovirgaria hyperparasitica]